MGIVLRGGTIAMPGAGPWRADIACAGPRIVAVAPGATSDGALEIDCSGLTLGPGFVDVHVHGGGGRAFFTTDAARIEAYCEWAPQNGVTSFLVSTIGRDAAHTEEVFSALRPVIGRATGAEPLGFHLEGPFINPVRKGAFDPRMLRDPEPAEFRRFQEAAGGHIRHVTIAPELPRALELNAVVHELGAIPAMGHTDATVEQALAGFDSGMHHVTHLFNAMRPIHQREGGPIVAAMLEARATCELICDGAHVAPELLRLAYGAIGPARAVVVTDNLHLAGTLNTEGRFGDRPVTVEGAKAVREDGTIVGSVATMDQHFRNVIAFLGVDMATAFRLCATNPAAIAGASGRKGRIAPDMDADIVALDSEGRVRLTICRGEIAFDSRIR